MLTGGNQRIGPPLKGPDKNKLENREGYSVHKFLVFFFLISMIFFIEKIIFF